MNTGQLVGIIVSAVVLVVFIGIGLRWIWRNRVSSKEENTSSLVQVAHSDNNGQGAQHTEGTTLNGEQKTGAVHVDVEEAGSSGEQGSAIDHSNNSNDNIKRI